MNLVVYGQKDALFELAHTKFQPKPMLSLRLA